MWDNRATKRNPKQPDFKCKDKTCLGVIWPPRDAAPRGVPQPAVKPLSTQGKEPYSAGPRIPAMDGPVDTAKLDTLFGLYSACLDHVLAVEVPKLHAADIGASPESVGAMTAVLVIQAVKF